MEDHFWKKSGQENCRDYLVCLQESDMIEEKKKKVLGEIEGQLK